MINVLQALWLAIYFIIDELISKYHEFLVGLLLCLLNDSYLCCVYKVFAKMQHLKAITLLSHFNKGSKNSGLVMGLKFNNGYMIRSKS